MERRKKRLKNFIVSLQVGWFLALRQVRRSSKATTILIIFVMMLTFLNLVVVRGVLVGLIQGSTDVYKSGYAGDVLLTTLPKKDFIENSPSVISTIKSLPWVKNYSARYVEGATIEANYKTRIKLTDKPDAITASVVGIDPVKENLVTSLQSKVIEGSYLTSADSDSIMIGANFLKKYLNIEAPGLTLLDHVAPGDRVRLTIAGNVKEFTVKGIVKGKVDQVDFRVFMLDTTLRNLIGRTDYNVDEVSIQLEPKTDPYIVKEALIRSGAGQYARIQTWEESLPKFLLDIKDTFGLLGNVIGSIGLVVASITIFIVIFVNAITRRKYIGILKGIGIDKTAIEFAYVLQAFFYAGAGVLIGLAVLYGFLVPFVTAHPIKFPFSDGILVAELPNTLMRALSLMIATLIAGYIPARIVAKQNTLDAILGRK
jgi:ABC-type lipoprotein release transport system permease subunit